MDRRHSHERDRRRRKKNRTKKENSSNGRRDHPSNHSPFTQSDFVRMGVISFVCLTAINTFLQLSQQYVVRRGQLRAKIIIPTHTEEPELSDADEQSSLPFNIHDGLGMTRVYTERDDVVSLLGKPAVDSNGETEVALTSFVGISPKTNRFESGSAIETSQESESMLKAANDSSSVPKKRRLLALGGSTTWGSRLLNREDSYPHVLGKLLGRNEWTVTNLAVRASDASFASMCVESMLRESDAAHGPAGDKAFDVILLEYSLNGVSGLELLMERLRKRYPSAILVYVHLWALRMMVDNIATKEKPRDILKKGLKFRVADEIILDMFKDPQSRWAWAASMVASSNDLGQELKDIVTAYRAGYFYELPIPIDPMDAIQEQLFGNDFHHLSVKGHSKVAHDLHVLLEEALRLQQSPSNESGSWGKGDQCYSWYETGNYGKVFMSGGTMRMFAEPDKYALHVGLSWGQPATIEFQNHLSEEQPVSLVIMAWAAGTYPKVNITLKAMDTVMPIQTIQIDPLHPNEKQRAFHITRSIQIGVAYPGGNRITINPIESMQRAFRVTGIVMCGDCVNGLVKAIETQ